MEQRSFLCTQILLVFKLNICAQQQGQRANGKRKSAIFRCPRATDTKQRFHPHLYLQADARAPPSATRTPQSHARRKERMWEGTSSSEPVLKETEPPLLLQSSRPLCGQVNTDSYPVFLHLNFAQGHFGLTEATCRLTGFTPTHVACPKLYQDSPTPMKTICTKYVMESTAVFLTSETNSATQKVRNWAAPVC